MMRSSGSSCNHPAIRLVEPRNALTGRRVFDVAQTVPDQPADIEFVVENAGAAAGITIDGGGVPFATARARNTVDVQFESDAAGRLSGRERSEDSAHDRSFRVIDLRRHVRPRTRPASG